MSPTVEPDTAGSSAPISPGARRVLVVGGALSLLGAVVVGALGSSGAGGLAAALVGAACTCGVAGLVSLLGAVREEWRGTRSPGGRILTGMGLLLLAPVLLVLAAGAAGTA